MPITKKTMTFYYPTKVCIEGMLSKKKSQKKQVIHLSSIYKNTYKLESNYACNHILFKKCVDMFLEDAKSRVLSSTMQNYHAKLMYLTTSPLAKLKMCKLKGVNVVEWLKWLKKHPTAKSKIRKNFIAEIKLLNTILNWYRNFIDENFHVPITKKHKQMCIYKHCPPRRPDYFIKPNDACNWVLWLKENRKNPVYWRLATFMLLTGARVGESCGLKWSEVDLKERFTRIVRRVRWDRKTKRPIIEEVTKTAQSTRLLILPRKLKKILCKMKKKALGEIVFTDKNGELLKYNAVQASFNAGFKALTLPWRSTHICRHTYATIALMKTKNLPAVQASLGHSMQRTTEHYAKIIASLNSETGEQTASSIFKNNSL